MKFASWPVLVGLQACVFVVEPEEEAPTLPTLCDNGVVTRYPEHKADNVFYQTDLWFELEQADPEAVLTVTGPGGAVVPGDTVVEGTRVSWVGEELLPLTTYEARVTYSCGESWVHWTTSEVGPPLDLDPTGQRYAFDLLAGDWTSPKDVAPLLGTMVQGLHLQVTPREVTTQGLTLSVTSSPALAQDPCVPTASFPAIGWYDPSFDTTGAEPLYLVFNDTLALLEDARLGGAFSSDGARIGGGRLQGLLHTEELGRAFGISDDPHAVCDMLAPFGNPCEPCPNGEGDACMLLDVEGMTGERVAGMLEERTQAEIDADPECVGP